MRTSGNVSNHFSEGVVDQEHLSLVEAVGSLHALQELGLVSGPEEYVSVSNLREQLGVVSVVEAVPSVVILEHGEYLSFI